MFVVAIAAVITAAVAVVFIAVVVGARQERPAELALRPQTGMAGLARCALGLYVSRDERQQRAALGVARERAAR